MDIGMLILRLVVGFTMAAHGAQKLFGWFGGYGLAGTGGFFEKLGFRPGKLQAFLAGVAEFGGGLLLAAGLATPVAAVVLQPFESSMMLTRRGGCSESTAKASSCSPTDMLLPPIHTAVW